MTSGPKGHRGFECIALDTTLGRATYKTLGGDVFSQKTDIRLDAEDTIRKATYWPFRRLVEFETKRGDVVVTRVPSALNPSPVGGRPIIYLDQNHWSTLSKIERDPARVPAPERVAGLYLRELARAGRVLLPVSAAHEGETTQWLDNDSRYHLGVTIMQLSEGWQMRDPIGVWKRELEADLALHAGRQWIPIPAIFTLEPWAIRDPFMRPERLADDDPGDRGFPPHIEYAFQCTLAATVQLSMFTNPDPIEKDPAGTWAKGKQRDTEFIAASGVDKRRRRTAATAVAFHDVSDKVAEAAATVGVSHDEFASWLTTNWETGSRTMPALAMFQSVLADRLLDPRSVWEDNDLNDLVFLTCASAYADHVVGERRTSGLLSQTVARMKSPVLIHSSLHSLMTSLSA